MKKFLYVLSWIPMGIAVTLLSGLIYATVQQAIRVSANSPQIQMAEDAAADMERKVVPGAIIPKVNVDMADSLAPFMIVYDDMGTVLASSVQLDGEVPKLPKGVLDYVREHKEDRVTWEPKPGVRVAAVIVRYVDGDHGFVLAGRSLREVEKLENKIFVHVAIGWAVTMVATLFSYYLFRR